MSVMLWSLGKLVRPWDLGSFMVLICWGMDRGEALGEVKWDVRTLQTLQKACPETGGGNPLSFLHPIFSCSLILVTLPSFSSSLIHKIHHHSPKHQGKQGSVQAGGEDSDSIAPVTAVCSVRLFLLSSKCPFWFSNKAECYVFFLQIAKATNIKYFLMEII